MKTGAVIENHTDFPAREVERLVRWTLRELDVDDRSLCVRVKRGRRGLSGRYYPLARNHSTSFHSWGSGYAEVEVRLPPGCSHLITMKLPERNYPRWFHYYSRRETPPELHLASWQEAIVALAAHEGTHHWQWLHKRERRSGRRRFQFRETECDFAAYRLVRRWRERRAA